MSIIATNYTNLETGVEMFRMAPFGNSPISPGWVVKSVYGPVWFYHPKKEQWDIGVTITTHQLRMEYTMGEFEARKVLETVSSKKEQARKL